MSKLILFLPDSPTSEKVIILYAMLKWVEERDKDYVEAYNILSKLNTPFAVSVTTRTDEESVPRVVINGSEEYIGLKQIKKFAQEWQKNQAPASRGCGCRFGCDCRE